MFRKVPTVLSFGLADTFKINVRFLDIFPNIWFLTACETWIKNIQLWVEHFLPQTINTNNTKNVKKYLAYLCPTNTHMIPIIGKPVTTIIMTFKFDLFLKLDADVFLSARNVKCFVFSSGWAFQENPQHFCKAGIFRQNLEKMDTQEKKWPPWWFSFHFPTKYKKMNLRNI